MQPLWDFLYLLMRITMVFLKIGLPILIIVYLLRRRKRLEREAEEEKSEILERNKDKLDNNLD